MGRSVADLVLGASFPLYGLDESFTGERWVRSWSPMGSWDGPFQMVSLAHGSADVEVAPTPMVEVGVRARRPHIDIWDTLVSALLAEAYSPGLGLRFEEWLSLKQREGLGALPWPTVEVTVDGISEAFAIQQLSEDWVALRELPEIWLYVHSRGTPPTDVALAQVSDRQRYIDGNLRTGTDLRTFYPGDRQPPRPQSARPG